MLEHGFLCINLYLKKSGSLLFIMVLRVRNDTRTVLFHTDMDLKLLGPFADSQTNTIVTIDNAVKSSLLGKPIPLDRSLGFNPGWAKPKTSKMQ